MKKYILPILTACIPLAYAIYVYPSLPESIPVHFGLNGEPDRYGGKNNIFMGGLMALIILIIMELAFRFDPKKKLDQMGENFDKFKLGLIIMISILGCFCVHSMAHGFSQSSMKFLFMTISCLYIILGNYMSSIKPNYFMGIRTPWTLKSESVWNKTHRLASKLFFGIGIVGLVLSWFDSIVFLVFFIGSTMATVFFLLWHSHHLFKLEKNSNDTKKDFTTILFILMLSNAYSQTYDWNETEKSIDIKQGKIYGTYIDPIKNKNSTIVLIIAGSGPTDRDGNNPQMKNNSLKFLAESLSKNGLATLRYDKRSIGKSKLTNYPEDSMRFDDMVSDAKQWIDSIKAMNKYKKIFILGHSEGSLIGMLSSAKAHAFISLAGTGYPADEIIKTQLKSKSQQLYDICAPYLDTLKKGQLLKNVDPSMYMLFRPSVQPYMISWMKYNPQTEFKKLTIPTFVIQGDSDIQVSIDNALILQKAKPNTSYRIIPYVNHVLKDVFDKTKQIQTYSDPTIPISNNLMNEIIGFILGC